MKIRKIFFLLATFGQLNFEFVFTTSGDEKHHLNQQLEKNTSKFEV